MQAIGDSFLLNTLESMGLDLGAVEAAPGADRTEHLDQIKLAVTTLLEQAAALAGDRLHDAVLEKKINAAGRLGEAFSNLRTTLTTFASRSMRWRMAIYNMNRYGRSALRIRPGRFWVARSCV